MLGRRPDTIYTAKIFMLLMVELSPAGIKQKINGEKSLEPNSQYKTGNHPNDILEGQIRECFGRVVYSHKTHEKCTGNIGAIIGIIISTSLLVLNACTSLLTDIRMRTKVENDLITERDTLASELHTVYCGAPSTNVKSYKKAQVALQKNEEMTFTDAEIDIFLPAKLKRCK